MGFTLYNLLLLPLRAKQEEELSRSTWHFGFIFDVDQWQSRPVRLRPKRGGIHFFAIPFPIVLKLGMKTKSLEGIFFNVCELNDKRDCRGLSRTKIQDFAFCAFFLSVFQPFPLILCLLLPLSLSYQCLFVVHFLPLYHPCSVPFLFLCYIRSTTPLSLSLHFFLVSMSVDASVSIPEFCFCLCWS